ncbi:MAG: PIN domain-containing protein [Chloroflexi bacterium]|nr:PIN domain-containing protein [Chloroflexota bacterium]
MPPILIDTNILVYSYDRGEYVKQGSAINTLFRLKMTGAGRLSTQVLAEFYVATTRSIRGVPPKLSGYEAANQVEDFLLAFPVFDVTAPIVLEAVRGVRDHRLPFFDAQLWATARLNQIPVILSEDFASGTYLDGVRIINPFAPDFDLESWIL